MTDNAATSALQQFVERSRKLYTLPAVALEVIELTGQPTVDTRALKETIEKDPALTIRILRVVNSSLFGLSRQVSDLNQALALLGIKPLKMLVLGFSLPKELTDGLEAETLRHYWQHTMIKAVSCRLLAERVGGVSGDEAFLAGQLQDIGQLALIQDLGQPYLRFLKHVETQHGDLLAMELETLGFDHLVLSGRMLEHWGLPASLSSAVAVTPDAQRIRALAPERRPLPQFLHLAELIAQTIENRRPETLERLLEAAREYTSLGYHNFEELAVTLQEQVSQLAKALSLELPEVPPYVEMLRLAHDRLSDVALEGAIELASVAAEHRVLEEARSLRDQLQAALATPGGNRRPSPPGTATFRHGPATHSPHQTINEPRIDPSARSPEPAPVPKTPIASIPNEPGLTGRVVAAIAHARVARCSTSLALVQVDNWDNVLLTHGPQQAMQLLQQLEVALCSWTQERGSALQIGDALFALVWQDCPRREALDLVRQLLTAVKIWQPTPGQPSGMTLSAGVSTLTLPPKNFPPQDLIEAARRCLSGAQLSGGDSVKSIEF